MTKAKSQVTWKNRITGHDEKPASWFLANEKNWRVHPRNQQEGMKGALDSIGWVQDVIVNVRTSEEWGADQGVQTLVDGHLRVTLALREGDNTPIPVKYVDLTPTEEAQVLATLDPLAAMAATDKAKLDELMRSVRSDDERVQAMLAELAEREGLEYGGKPEPVEDPGAAVDRAAELRQKFGVETGQLWQLGEHRLICGDCTDAAAVERVMGGEKATLLFTDPPYGVSIGAKNRLLNSVQKAGRNLADIESDDVSIGDLRAMLVSAFTLAKKHLADDCSVFVCSPQGGELGMMMMMMDAGLTVRHVLNWIKNAPTFSLGRLDYDYQHEPILFTWVKTHKRNKAGQFQTSVWSVDKPRRSPDHPTMKPVELPENALLNHTDAGDICLDPFLGSGTTMIACERLGRRCRAVEISPAYVSVALERWHVMTGQMPELLGAAG